MTDSTTQASDDTKRTESKVIDYMISIRGVWGRNRKEKFELVKLTRVPADQPLDVGAVTDAALARLAEMKAKAGLRWRLAAYPVTLETVEYSDMPAYTVEKHLLMSETTLARGTWEG